MPSIELSDISRFVGTRCIFSSVSLSVAGTDRIGIVGRNGEGKTTLLRIIAGDLHPDSGTVHISSGTSVGYLSQELPTFNSTVLEAAMEGKPQVAEIADKMRVVEGQMSSPGDDIHALLREYSRLQNRFDALGGYDLENEAAVVLAGLGFGKESSNVPTETLSGGQKVRLNLAKLLVSKPDVLLLDEPTNHLDIAGTEWLESYISSYPGAVLLVSHDRRFLDNVVAKIWEVEEGKISCYRGNYSSYLSQKEEALKRLEEQYAKQQELIEKTRAFIDRWKANAKNAGQARSRQKMLDKLEIIDRPRKRRNLSLQFVPSDTTGREVLRIEDFGKSFARPLFRDFTYLIGRGERIALVGPNGCGKTTFLRCLMGTESHDGSIKWGTGVRKGYLAQNLEFSSREHTILDEIKSLGVPQKEARDVLGMFLFSGDDSKKHIKDLSEGEKSRLSLVKLFLSDANVFLLDEPTNHLDLPSRQALESALSDFGGTIIFASHDRYFIDSLATKVFLFEKGTIRVFEGNYSYLRTCLESEMLEEPKRQKNGSPPKEKSESTARPESKEIEVAIELEALEQQISELESKERELSIILADPHTYEEFQNIPLKEWGLVRSRLDELYIAWERLMEKKSIYEDKP